MRKRVPSKHKSDIPGVLIYPDGREQCEDNAAGDREYHSRLMQMLTRQWCVCAGCKCVLNGTPTFGHQCSRGGGKRDDRLIVNGEWHNAALCMSCNSLQGSKRYEWDYSGIVPKWVPVNRDQAA